VDTAVHQPEAKECRQADRLPGLVVKAYFGDAVVIPANQLTIAIAGLK